MPPPTQPETVLSGRYRLDARIGAGGAGAVWRGYDTVLDRPVAVKLLHETLERDEGTRARFRREATAAAAIHHPHAAVVYDIGEDDGRAYLVMELVDGPSLADVIDGTPIDPGVVAAIGHQVAGALGEAHDRELAHRDVKPGNILLAREGAAKVVDFGIAKALGESTQQLTAVGTVVGTAAYLAPEQLESGGDIDGRADVYALGLVLHQLLTGRAPFSGTTSAELAAQRLVNDAPAPRRFQPSVPSELDDVVARATRRDPADRYADGRALAAALAPFVPERPDQLVAELAHRKAGSADHTRPLTIAEPVAAPTAVIDPTRAPADEPGIEPEAVCADPTVAIDPAAMTPPSGSPSPAVPRTAPEPAPPPDPEPTRTPRPEPTPPPEGEPRPRMAMWTALAVVVLVALAAGVLSDGGGGSGGGGGGEAAGPYPITNASDFDPLGDDGREHPEDVPAAHDGNAGTAWTTSRYNTASFGGLKRGVGIWFDLGESVEVSQVQLLLATPGISFEVYAADDPFQGADLGEPVGAVSDAPAEPTVDVGGTKGRFWLVWITSVPGGRARIAEVEFDRP